MKNSLVSIIVTCYKLAEYLPYALDSVLSQSNWNWECLIVNDGSPDNTEEISKKYCEKDSRFKYVYQKNSGVAIARNNGIRQSSGEYIVPLDADDFLIPEFIEMCVNCFEQHPEATIVYGDVQRFGEASGIWKSPQYSYETMIWGNVIFNTSMYRREDFDRTTGYNPNMIHGYEDWDFYLSLLNEKSIVYHIDKPLYYYRVREQSRSALNAIEKNWKESHRQIFLNHQELYAKYVPDIIMLHNKGQELEQLKSSKAFKLGEKIASVYRKIRYTE